MVKVPVNGRSPAGELARRDPQLLVTSAVANGAEAHSHVAPPKNSSEAAYRITHRVGGGEFAYLLGEEMDFV